MPLDFAAAKRGLAPIMLTLVLISPGCKSKEEQACRAQERWTAELARALGDEPEPVSKEDLAECIAMQKREQTEFGLSDEQYEALLDCKVAAKDMAEGLACMGPAMTTKLEDTMAKVGADVEAELDSARLEAAAAIAKLEAHVGSGVDAQTLAMLREPPANVPPQRITEVIDDALQLIESGRVDAEHPVSVRLQPGLGADVEPRKGLEAAELSFVDKQSGATVGRLAPLKNAHFGAKSKQVAALFDWMLEDPEGRRVELIVTMIGDDDGLSFEPPDALYDARPRFEAAGIADRPVIWRDGKSMTLAQWAER